MRSIGEIKTSKMPENLDSKYNSLSLTDSSCSFEKLNSNFDKNTESRLFVGLVDINKSEEDLRNLYHRVVDEGSNYQTNFWSWFNSIKEEKEQIDIPGTIEELIKNNEIHDEVDKALDHYNQFMPRNQYF